MRFPVLGFLLLAACGNASSTFVAPPNGGVDAAGDAGESVFSDGGALACKGEVVKWWEASSPGPDGTWGTADDVVTGLRDLRLDDRAAVGAIVWHSARGADAIWDTKDDAINLANRYEWNGTSLVALWNSSTPGADGVFGTADDPPDGVAAYTNDANGHLLEQRFFGAAGADAKWLTADDVQQGRTAYEFNAAGTQGILRNYGSPGTDGVWGTGDDVIGFVLRPSGTTYRVADKIVLYNQAGADGVWATSDDIVGSVMRVDCAKATITSYSAPGADATWETGDDVVQSYGWLTGRADCLVAACVAFTGPN